MRTYLILLLVATIMLLSVNTGSAYSYLHTITPAPPVPVSTFVTDTVTPRPASATFDGASMRFIWKRPKDSVARVTIVPKILGKYTDTLPAASNDKTGKWKIEAEEFVIKKKKVQERKSRANFNVIQAPEFSKFGLAIPILLIGIFYMRLRKSILK